MMVRAEENKDAICNYFLRSLVDTEIPRAILVPKSEPKR